MLTRRLLPLFAFGVLTSLSLSAQNLTLAGPGAATRTLTAAEWAALPRVTQTAKDKTGKSHRYEGVPLPALLQLLQAPQGKALHGPALSQALLVTAADDYRVVVALPELDPTFNDQTVLLADRCDGKALPSESGPYQLIIPREKRPARWVKQVRELRVVEVKP
ncbi:molybdopterin-dependent oxidoreductase [Hymenobacter aerophilus]|uniref:molybdopterin-dependent oxidoreductase n=1 Tax=Hymenobacter aerophilus TaxID=119644 RepID=UPI0003734577|nr:molybdopterin-dependent oxidoreductase [Hymenobacter aerophilus]